MKNQLVISDKMEFLQEQVKGLPKELQDYIGEFNCEHRVFMKEVLTELQDRHDWKYECNNYDCSTNCYDEFVKRSILSSNCIFCCELCAEIGESEMRYDYRKALASGEIREI